MLLGHCCHILRDGGWKGRDVPAQVRQVGQLHSPSPTTEARLCRSDF